MKLTLGFSPCPNDTFIFDALVHGKIDTGGLEFEPVLEDVETLNQWALQGKLDITKLSLPAFFQTRDQYALLPSGSALGEGVGPLLIAKEPVAPEEVADATIAIPGTHTTANLLLSVAFPGATKRVPMLFSDIENAVLTGQTKLGVIIHENRFTYQQRGLLKVLDLGAYWEEQMKVPVPLGSIAVKRSIDPAVANRLGPLIRSSLEWAFGKYPYLSPYVQKHAQEMDESVMRQHINLYVNDYSLDLGTAGKQAIETLYKVFAGQTPGHGREGATPSLFL